MVWIGDIFAREKAEQVTLGDLQTLFSPPPELPSLEHPSNHIILGAKGSGKSTLLRSLVYPVWEQRNPRPTFMGVYVSTRFEDASALRLAYEEASNQRLFEHFFVSSIFYDLCTQWSSPDDLQFSLVE